ncbi:MAG TPA: hypothetical protein VNV16_05150 [Methylibium sp.]|nr:hypothetical protein [Methylibium sp.]
MDTDRPNRPRAAEPRTVWHTDTLEWEELPSLADSLTQRLVRIGVRHEPSADSGFYEDGAPCWAETQAAELEMLTPSEPLREVLAGLAVREVSEPDVFRHFFGAR